jgi:hypothetical protein
MRGACVRQGDGAWREQMKPNIDSNRQTWTVRWDAFRQNGNDGEQAEGLFDYSADGRVHKLALVLVM